MNYDDYAMMKKATKTTDKEKQKELALMLFLQGISQAEISDKVGVSKQTINKWAKENGWQERRAATSISRREIVNKMLRTLDEKITAGDWNADEIIKCTNAIEKLDKQTNVVTIIEVFSIYNKWLVSRMQVDRELTPELVKLMNKYQDLFIGESLNSTNIQLLEG